MADLAGFFVMNQLERVVQFLYAHWWISLNETAGNDHADKDERFRHMIAVAAYGYVVNDAAWRQLCEEQGVDADAVLSTSPGYVMLTECDWLIRRAARTSEEMTELLQQETGQPDAVAVTVEGVLLEWRKLFDVAAAKWS